MDYKRLHQDIFQIDNMQSFNDMALQLFNLHLNHNPVYREYIHAIGCPEVKSWEEIPCLPIEFFKTKKILLEGLQAIDFFSSSGTTGLQTGKHFIYDFHIYEESFSKGFRHFFGEPGQYCILALLPNYLEQQHSSLIYMMKHLIHQSAHPESDFYLYDRKMLSAKLKALHNGGQKTILFGVTYALLDLIADEQFFLPNTIIFETGGMKGRRKEMIREELHQLLCAGFGVNHIFSEYGMTELFSQAYSQGEGIFECQPWMRINIRQSDDPFRSEKVGRTGGINVLDLANIYSCPFIATQDLGKMHPDGSFEVLGRMDHSDVRGCNLMIQD